MVPVATVVEDEDVCPYATRPIRAIADATPRNNLVILNFLFYQVAAEIAAKGYLVLPENPANQVSKWMRQSFQYSQYRFARKLEY